MRALTVAAALIALAPAAVAAPAMKLGPAPKEIDAANRGPAHLKAPISQDDVPRDVAADRKRDELIAELRAILPRTAGSERKADLSFQLAELCWEKSRYLSLQEVKKYDDAFADWSQGHKAGVPQPKVSTRESDTWRTEALRLYQDILKEYPYYPRKDEVIFVVAYNLYESGRRSEAVLIYDTLVRQYPGSRFVPDAWVQMGEHYFVTNDLSRARAAFEKAAAFRLPKLYPFAVYKLAWCDYNAQQYDRAIARFKEVIRYSDEQQDKQGSRDRIQLKSEALKDIVLSYAQIDAIDSATAYLREKGGPAFLDYLNKLAATFFDTGKFDQAIRVYRSLEAEAPTHVRAPAWQQKILLAYDKLNQRDSVVAEIKRLVADYGPQSAWARANAGQKGALAEANDLSESALRELVQDYHQEAIKTKSAATYRLARDIYRQYLETFPESETAYSMRFYYAEILYALEDWDAAGDQYGKVVQKDPKGQYAPKAAYDAILALEKSVNIARGKLARRELADQARVDERKAKGQVDQERAIKVEKVTRETGEEPIPANEQKLIAACETYLEVAGHPKDEIVIRYRAAFVYYDHRHYLQAAKRFGDIIRAWPGDAWSQKAADLSLDILQAKEEWLALSDLAREFHQDRRLSPPGSEFEKRVARLSEDARFKYVQLEIYQKKKDLPLAASEFRAFVQQYPRSENAPKALYNALLIADQADQLDLEVAAGDQLLREYPQADEQVVQLALPALANACERSARYPEAVKWYEEAQRRWPGDSRAPDWLFNAAVWREGMADDAGALADWQKYVRQYATRPDAARIAFNIGLILERQKDFRKVAGYWKGYQREWSRAATAGQLLLARYQEGLALREQRALDPGVPSAMADVAQRFRALPDSEKLPQVVDAAAHARFIGIENAFGDFSKIHFHYPRQADLVYALRNKNARMSRLLEAYTDVIRFGSPRWSEAALERLGEAYRNFNKGLLDAPMPRGLDPEQQDLYRTTLENQALPLEDKATEAFEKAVQTGRKTQVYSEWLVKAQDFLREYKPDEYGEVHKPALLDSDSSRPVGPALLPNAGSGGD